MTDAYGGFVFERYSMMRCLGVAIGSVPIVCCVVEVD